MKSKLILGLLSLFMMFSMTSCMEKVDAGCEGIKVNLYGSDKGVDDASLVTGVVWYNPWTTTVYEYPTYVQTIDYEPFTINAKDGSEFTVDPTVSLKIIDGKSPAVFKKYRKELNEVIKGTLYNYVKDAFRIQLNKFTTDDIVSKRDSIESAIERYLTQALAKENFQLEQLTSGLKYPQTIVESVNAKNKAIQQAMQVENEVKVAEAQAVLESGNFESKLFKEYNNPFGLYNSKKKDYFKFKHWTDAVAAYISMVEYRYAGGDYYRFLEEFPYAQDSRYIDKVRMIESNLPP